MPMCRKWCLSFWLKYLTQWSRQSLSYAKFPSILWHPKRQSCVQKFYPMYHSSSAPPPHPLSLGYVYILFSHQRLDLPSRLLHSGFRKEILCEISLLSMCAALPAHLILSDLFSLIMFRGEYKLRSSPLCNFLQHITLCPFLVQISSSAICYSLLPLQSIFLPYRQSIRPIQNYSKAQFCIFKCLRL
jgi:hypothetical protein